MKNWGEYANLWKLNRDRLAIEDRTVGRNSRDSYLQYLGDEWGNKASVNQFVQEFIGPYVDPTSIVLEIGSGGGRIAAKIAPSCGHLICLDVEFEMAKLGKSSLATASQLSWIITSKHQVIIPLANASLDFAYSFDTFVHLDRRVIYKYLLEASRVLKVGSKLALHVATLETPLGWDHFSDSIRRNVVQGQFGSFEYIDSHEVLRMAEHAQFRCLKSSLGRTGNFYYERDAIFLLEKSRPQSR
jgi:ubiquinone/menaquinone biosynthesis C-methylase UbiE